MTANTLKSVAKKSIRAVLPLSFRKRLAAWLAAQRSVGSRHWWALELLRDLERTNPNEYHRFLWRHHLAYAQTYEVGLRFGAERIHPSRVMLFEDVEHCLQNLGVDPHAGIESILDVGCSLGYLLEYLERGPFSGAKRFAGIDIDKYAVDKGREYLAGSGSNVELVAGDISEVPRFFGQDRFDVVLCTGVLMYLDQVTATRMMAMLVRHTGRFLVLSGLAHPDVDNRQLRDSERRGEDRSFIHNFDAMLEGTDFEIIFRRWEGTRLVDGNSIYFLIAAPKGTAGI